MSQYIILVETPLLIAYNPVSPSDKLTQSLAQYHALTGSDNPQIGLAILQNHCPIPLRLVHTIHAAQRADALKLTLEIKFRAQALHSFWYNLSSEQVAFIQSINRDNCSQVIGLIHRQERKPDLDPDQANALAQDILKKAEAALQ